MDDGIVSNHSMPLYTQRSSPENSGVFRPKLLASRPHPDEDWRGHIIRIGKENLLSGGRAVNRLLREGSSGAGQTPLEAVARISGTEYATYVRSHTLMPMIGLLLGNQAAPLSGLRWSSGLIKRSIDRTLSQHIRYCPDCVAEDRGFWGYPYWRRHHQVPGRLQCSKHSTGLQSVPTSETCSKLMLPPTHATLTDSGFESASQDFHAAVNRYAEICDTVLDHHAPINFAEVTRRIRRHLRQVRRNLCTSFGLSDYVQATFSYRWLVEVYPALAAKQRGTVFHSIDNLISVTPSSRNPPRAIGILLTLAAIFDSSEAAIDCLMLKPEVSASEDEISNRVLSQFLAGCDLATIAADMGISPARVQERLLMNRDEILQARMSPEVVRTLDEFVCGASLEKLRNRLLTHNVELLPFLRLLVAYVLQKNPIAPLQSALARI
ncbi:MAG: TniQ family protein [Burkholderiales bacterium]|nr:TniQ family protein [Burkholderiales bacterium]